MTLTALEKARAGYVVDEDGCWVWQRGFSGAAKQAMVWVNTTQRVPVARLLWEAENGKPLGRMVLIPKCDHGQACVNPAHKWMTNRASQQKIAMKKAHQNRSYMQTYMAKKSQMKLDPEKVKRAWDLRLGGSKLKDIAEELGVCISTLSVLFSGKTHKHLSPLGFLGSFGLGQKKV